MSRIGMLTFPAIRDGKNFVSNIKRNTKHSRVDRNIRHGLQRGFREWNTKRKTRLETTSTDVHRPTMSNQKLKSLTSHKATETNQVQRRPPQSMVFYVSRKKHQKKQYNDLVFYAHKNQITCRHLTGPCAGMWQTSLTARWTAGFSISRQLPDEPLWRAKRVALCLPLVEKTPSCGLSVPFPLCA